MGKKLISTLFCTILLALTEIKPFTIETSNEAKIFDTNTIDINTQIETDIDTALLDRGYPEIIIDTMNYEAKKEIYYDPDLIFSSAYIMFPEESQFIAGDGVLPIIEPSVPGLTMSLVNSIKKETNSDNQKKCQYINVTFSYHWTKIPFFRCQDPIIISWDEKKFVMNEDSFHKVDQYDGYIATIQGIKKTFQDQMVSFEPGYADNAPSYVKWYADLKNYDGITKITSLHGYGSFQLFPKTEDNIENNSPIYAQYIHKTPNM